MGGKIEFDATENADIAIKFNIECNPFEFAENQLSSYQRNNPQQYNCPCGSGN